MDEEKHDEYRAIVGGLLYLSVNTRFDIAFQVGKLARFMSAPTTKHLGSAYHVLRCLKGTSELAVHYIMLGVDRSIHAYSDVDFAGDKTTMKSTTGVLIKMGESPIIWTSRLQSLVTTSTAEAELAAAAAAAKEILWMQELLIDIGERRDKTLHCDNEATVQSVRNTTAVYRCAMNSVRVRPECPKG